MDLSQFFDFLATLHPLAPTILMALGTLVVVLSAVDAMLPKVNFMDKFLAIPILGDILKGIMRFSVLRSEKKDNEPKV